MEEFSRFSDLQRFLNSLPAPPPGKRRYFRGQSNHYPRLIPTGLRSSKAAPKWALWHFYSDFLAQHIWNPIVDRNTGENVSENEYWRDYVRMHGGTPDEEAMTGAMQIWGYAIAQHYGPGSHYLDVSHSIATALWFGLRRIADVEVEVPNVPTHSGTLWKADEGPAEEGWLYVFDLEPWVVGTPLRHGHVVDLAEAPPFFHSTRMQRQSACLLYADSEVDGGDLMPLTAAACPIRIRWPMEGAPGLQRSIEEMFPGPDEDLWYARFLSMPLTPRTRNRHSNALFEHPMSLSLYFPSDQRALPPITRRISIISPHLLYPEIPHGVNLAPYRALIPNWSDQRLRQTIPILLEGPIVAATPPASLWNPALVHGEQATETVIFDMETFEPLGAVSLDNILVEFSPLEKPGWEANEPIQLLRAIWLIREGRRYILTAFGQQWCNAGDAENDGATPLMQVGPLVIEFSEDDGRFGFRHPQMGILCPLESLAPLDKELYCVLEFLRFLSPELKPHSTPALVLPRSDQTVAFVGNASRQLLRLEKPKSDSLPHHFLPRVAGTEERFVGGFSRFEKSYAGIDMFRIPPRDVSLFAHVDADWIRNMVENLRPEDGFLSDQSLSPFGANGLRRQQFGPRIARDLRNRTSH